MDFDTAPQSSPEFVSSLVMRAIEKASIDYDFLLTATRVIFDIMPVEFQAKHKKIQDILRKYENNLEKQRTAQRLARTKGDVDGSHEYLGKARGQDEMFYYDKEVEQEHSTNKTAIMKYYSEVIKQITPKEEEDVMPGG